MAGIKETAAALRLINTPKIGAKSFYRLTDEYGSAEEAVAALQKSSVYRPWSEERALQEIHTAEKLGIKILLYKDELYPAALKVSLNPPPLLYVRGRTDILDYGKSLAIVGARSASVNGRKAAAKIAFDLTEQGVCIISGMARGIDTAAHRGALYACGGTGRTIAVLGTGADVVYPPENEELYHQISVNGCIISEVPLGTGAAALRFPQRNRIISALSEGVLVIEAGGKSGSLITARFAQEQGKRLFAMPGTPGESRCRGSNLLIKEGALLAETSADILPFLKGNKTPPATQNERPKQKVLVFENNDDNFSTHKKTPTALVDFLTADGTDIDELIRLTGRDAAAVTAEILELELAGVVVRRPGNKVALTDQN